MGPSLDTGFIHRIHNGHLADLAQWFDDSPFTTRSQINRVADRNLVVIRSPNRFCFGLGGCSLGHALREA